MDQLPKQCSVVSCRAVVAVDEGTHCLEHAEPAERSEALSRLASEAKLRCTGIVVREELWREIERNIPRGTRPGAELNFEETKFECPVQYPEGAPSASFVRAVFEAEASFGYTAPNQDLRFDAATFFAGTRFSGSSFRGSFSSARFLADVTFHEVTLVGTSFSRADFASRFHVSRSGFHAGTDFTDAQFHGDVVFEDVTFRGAEGGGFNSGQFLFGKCRFEGPVTMGDVAIAPDASLLFDDSRFDAEVKVTALALLGYLSTRRTRFGGRVTARVSSLQCLTLSEATFLGGIQLFCAGGEVIAESVQFAAPSLIAGAPPIGLDAWWGNQNHGLWMEVEAEGWDPETELPRVVPDVRRPRIISLAGTDVGVLVLSLVDVGPCRFYRAHNLDRLRIEGPGTFVPVPGRWRARRGAIAEEHLFRARADVTPQASISGQRVGSTSWYSDACRPQAHQAWEAQPEAWRELLHPVEIASIYRNLRKGREEGRDEPSASDLYYGEMEMRRKAITFSSGEGRVSQTTVNVPSVRGSSAEWLLLHLYWITSGYGTRAWRSALSFLLVLVLGSAFLAALPAAPPATWVANRPAAQSRPRPATGEVGRPVLSPSVSAIPSEGSPSPPSVWQRNLLRNWKARNLFGFITFNITTLFGSVRDPSLRLSGWQSISFSVLRVVELALVGLTGLALRARVKR